MDRDVEEKISYCDFQEIINLKSNYEGNNNSFSNSLMKKEKVNNFSESFKKSISFLEHLLSKTVLEAC